MKKILEFLAEKSDRVCFMLTKKSVKDSKQFIPNSLKREQKIYSRFVEGRSDKEEIFKAHEWSPELRSWLIEKGGIVLLDKISNLEVVSLLNNRKMYSVELLEEALKRVTLNREDISKVNVNQITDLIQYNPEHFVNMATSQAYNIGVLSLIIDGVEKSNSKRELASTKLKELLKLDPEFSPVVFARAACYFASLTVNPKEQMTALSKKCFSAYKIVVENLEKRSETEQRDFVLDALDNFRDYPQAGEKEVPFKKLGDKYDKRQISLFWLYKAMKLVEYGSIVSKLEDIFFQKNMLLENKIKNDLIEALLESTYCSPKFLKSIPGKLQGKSKWLKTSRSSLQEFIPFNQWDEKDWKEAISFLIENDNLSYDRLSLLEGDKREYAKSELKLRAQILILEGDDCVQIETLLSNSSQRVEIWQTIVSQYLSNTLEPAKKRLLHSFIIENEIPAKQLQRLIEKLSEEDFRSIISQKNLSEEELLVIRTSRFRYLTANL